MRYPKSTEYALCSVRRKRPAPTRSTRPTATCNTTKAARIRAARAPVATVPPSARSDVTVSRRRT